MHTTKASHSMHYHHLLIMVVLSFVSMYVLMYAMVDRLPNVFMSLNQAYMAALMTAPMVIIELVVMRMTYSNKTLNQIMPANSTSLSSRTIP